MTKFYFILSVILISFSVFFEAGEFGLAFWMGIGTILSGTCNIIWEKINA